MESFETHGTSRPGTGSDLQFETDIDYALEHGITDTGNPHVDSVTAVVRWTKQQVADLNTIQNTSSSDGQDS